MFLPTPSWGISLNNLPLELFSSGLTDESCRDKYTPSMCLPRHWEFYVQCRRKLTEDSEELAGRQKDIMCHRAGGQLCFIFCGISWPRLRDNLKSKTQIYSGHKYKELQEKLIPSRLRSRRQGFLQNWVRKFPCFLLRFFSFSQAIPQQQKWQQKWQLSSTDTELHAWSPWWRPAISATRVVKVGGLWVQASLGNITRICIKKKKYKGNLYLPLFPLPLVPPAPGSR